jgi:hypothetical protein
MFFFVDLLGISIASTVTYIAQHDTDTDLNTEAWLLNDELSLFYCLLRQMCQYGGFTQPCCFTNRQHRVAVLAATALIILICLGLHAPSYLRVRSLMLDNPTDLMIIDHLQFESRIMPKACSLSCFASFCFVDGETCYIIALHTLRAIYSRTFSPDD